MTPSDSDGSAGQPRKERRRYRRRRQRKSTLPSGGTRSGFPVARRIQRQVDHLLRRLPKSPKDDPGTRWASVGEPDTSRSRPGKSSRSGHRHRRHRKGKRTPAPIRWLRDGPAGELAELLIWPFQRHPIVLSLGVASLLWWFWPWIRPQMPLPAESNGSVTEIISVDATDPRRTETALNIWAGSPRAILVVMMMDGPSHELSARLVRDSPLVAARRHQLVNVWSCGDTLTQTADLTDWLDTRKGPGHLMVVTSPEHMPRLRAISEVMAGSRGWRVEGVGSLTSERKPESPLRLVRDQLRAQIWRATGWSGKEGLICPGRARGLL